MPDRESWLARRDFGIGASEVAAILGESKWDSPYSLYCKKRGLIEPDDSDSLAMEIGRGMEAVAANIYERITGREVFDLGAYTIQRHPVLDCLTCTLDRVVHDIDKGWGCLNLKAVGASKAEEWSEGPPRVYWIQEQAEMAVTGLAWASLGVVISNYEFRWCDVERDDDFIDNVIIPAALRFYAHLQCGTPPAADGHPATSRSLSIKLSEDPYCDSAITLPGDFFNIDCELVDIKDQIAELTYRKDLLENQIKAAIGEHTYGVIPGRARYSWSLQKRGDSYTRILRRKEL